MLVTVWRWMALPNEFCCPQSRLIAGSGDKKLIPAASRTSAEASCMGKSVLESVFPLLITKIFLHTLSREIDARYLVRLAVHITDRTSALSAQTHNV